MDLATLERRLIAPVYHDPERRGRGWYPNQRPGFYRPAIEQDKIAFLPLLEAFSRRGGGLALQIGLGPFGGSHYALALVASKVLSIDRERSFLERARARPEFDPVRDVFLEGDSRDPRTLDRLREALSGLESPALCLIDGGTDYRTIAEDWRNYAPLVERGGLVAVVDSRFRSPETPFGPASDLFLLELQRDFVRPLGLPHGRFEGAPGIFWYEVTEACLGRPHVLEGRPPLDTEPEPVPLFEERGFTVYQWGDRFAAVPAEDPPLSPLRIYQGSYHRFLRESSLRTLQRALETWTGNEASLNRAAEVGADGDLEAALRKLAPLSPLRPLLLEALTNGLNADPYATRNLRDLGLLLLSEGRTIEALALLERCVDRSPFSLEPLKLSARVLRACEGESAAKDFLAKHARIWRIKEMQWICLDLADERLLYSDLDLLMDAGFVLLAGGRPEDRKCFEALGIPFTEAESGPPADSKSVLLLVDRPLEPENCRTLLRGLLPACDALYLDLRRCDPACRREIEEIATLEARSAGLGRLEEPVDTTSELRFRRP